MSDKTTDFMLEEYKQIANAYQDLHSQQNELVKSYLTIVAIPASVIALVIQLIEIDNISPATINETVSGIVMPLLLGLMFSLSFVGIAVLLALVSIRGEALLYVRTVNCIRRYFVENESSINLRDYLVLPDHDNYPPFWEGPSTRSFWNVTMVALLNSFFAFATFFSLFRLIGIESLLASSIIACVWFVLQYFLHRILLQRREDNYNTKFEAPYLTKYKIGIDLDGVLNDLAGSVISIARDKYGINIVRSNITTHRLDNCTTLTPDQVKDIFSTPKIFEDVAPLSDAINALSTLSSKGYDVHILTDRFWNDNDWDIATNWLKRYGFKWNQLYLVHAKDKPEFSKSLGLKFFIEDNIGTAVELASVCKQVFLLDRPYNQGELPGNVFRVDDWNSILEKFIDFEENV